MTNDIETAAAELFVRREGRIGRLVVSNIARHNAADLNIWRAFPVAIHALAQDPEIRVVVIEGAGGQDFMSGADIRGFLAQEARAQAIRSLEQSAADAWDAVRACPKPVIASVRGYCLGGGLALAACCDMRVAADDAIFSIPAVKLGAGYRAEGVARLRRIVGPAFAKEILLTGRQFGADEALHMGLVNSVVPKAGLESAVARLSGEIADGAPLTVAAILMMDRGLDLDPRAQDPASWDQAVAACFESQDFAEGCAAFAQKRSPAFTGR